MVRERLTVVNLEMHLRWTIPVFNTLELRI